MGTQKTRQNAIILKSASGEKYAEYCIVPLGKSCQFIITITTNEVHKMRNPKKRKILNLTQLLFKKE